MKVYFVSNSGIVMLDVHISALVNSWPTIFPLFLTDRKFSCLLCCLASKLESRSDYNSQNEASVWCVFVLACVCALGKL